MTTTLFALGAFIITILFLVTIHEYGHYAMARYFGVKIEKFSVGFGKPIFRWYNKAGIEFSLAWIPLGGYVKMYGEHPNELESSSQLDTDISDFTRPEPIGKSYSSLPPFHRLLIAFAGPAVNLLFTVLVFWLVFVMGKDAIKPIIGTVQPDSPIAQARLKAGDEFSAINGNKTRGDLNTILALVDRLGDSHVEVRYIRNEQIHTTILDLSGLPVGSETHIEQALGFDWAVTSEFNKLFPAKIGRVQDGTPAQQSGLQVNDVISAVNDQPVRDWSGFTAFIKQSLNQPLKLDVDRNGNALTLTLTPQAHENNPKIGFAGIAPSPVDLSESQALLAKYRTVERYGLLTALPKAISETGAQAVFLLRSLRKVITGQFSVKNLGGPLSIADYSGKSLQAGWYVYMNYLAMISLTLAVMNLLPIPVLDGGHIVLCALEILYGKALPENVIDIATRIGMSLLLTFMAMMLLLDLGKYLG